MWPDWGRQGKPGGLTPAFSGNDRSKPSWCHVCAMYVLAGHRGWLHALYMITISDDDAAAIQAAFHQDGELSAAAEVHRRFRAIEGERAREWARMIAAWKPLPAARPRKTSAPKPNK